MSLASSLPGPPPSNADLLDSLVGGTLPLAGPAMYSRLNPHWAGTLLGLLEVMLIPIPFVFYRYGHRIRMRSRLIRSMQTDKEKLAGKKSKWQQRQQEVASEGRETTKREGEVEEDGRRDVGDEKWV